MQDDAEPTSPASNAGHPSPPSRLLSKHRPRRRAAAPRPPLPPPPPPPARCQPDLTLCSCCGVRFPPPPPGSKRRPVRPLSSLWRIVLLCPECLSLVRSAAVCSYCLSLDNLPPEGSSVACRRCKRCVHRSCIAAEHRTLMIQPVDVEDFLCVDCCPTVRSKGGGTPFGMNLESYARHSSSLAEGNAGRKAVEVKLASKRGKDVLALAGSGEGAEGRAIGDSALLDGELALQLHLAMNGSVRISRSGNSSGSGSAEHCKGEKDVGGGRKFNGHQEICVTNTMAQLDDETDSETELACDRVPLPKRFRGFDPSVTVVLALECANNKRSQDSMKSKKKAPIVTKQHGLVDRFKKKYSKRKSSKQEGVKNTSSKTMPNAKDMDGDNGTNGIAPVK
ncbi:hypothetical protein ACP4OV_019761 [Aristida adscensionis]